MTTSRLGIIYLDFHNSKFLLFFVFFFLFSYNSKFWFSYYVSVWLLLGFFPLFWKVAHPAVLRSSSWLCPQKSLIGQRKKDRVLEIKPEFATCKESSYQLCYHSTLSIPNLKRIFSIFHQFRFIVIFMFYQVTEQGKNTPEI